jgi:plastocyanin
MRLTALLTAFALSSANTGAVTLSAVVTDPGGAGIPEAVVWAVPTSGPAPATPPRPAMVDQINKEFVPFVIPVQVGAAVTFPNKDNIRHHVYSFSPAKVFDLKLYSGVPAKPVSFDKPGPVALGCNIHDWMIAYVVVLPTPYFAKSGADGSATLAGVPTGRYRLEIWHPRLAKPVVSELTLPDAGAREAISLTLKTERRIRRAPEGKSGGY